MFYFSIISFTGCIELTFAKNHIYWLAFEFGYVVVARNDVKQNVRKFKDEQVPRRPSAAAESSRAAPPGGSYTPGEGFRMCPRHQEILRTECRG